MYEYRVGGSLSACDPTYVERSADESLYQALLRGEFCYVLAPRQMGKSSLRLRTCHRLETLGQGRCAAISMTRIGDRQTTPEQWYLRFIYELQRKFNLPDPNDILSWWQRLGPRPPTQKLKLFIEEILFAQYPNNRLFLFLDEVDSMRTLNFPVNDLFELMQSYGSGKAKVPNHCHLTWAIFGVATLANLVTGSTPVLFSQEGAIALSGFSPLEAEPLIRGLATLAQRPHQVLMDVLYWTGGQPFLTQKLCRLLQERNDAIVAGMESEIVGEVVRSHIIDRWENQDEPEHLQTIRDRLLGHTPHAERLLRLYHQILFQGSIAVDRSEEQAELLLSGIVVEQDGCLGVANPIYAAVFNLEWINQHLRSCYLSL